MNILILVVVVAILVLIAIILGFTRVRAKNKESGNSKSGTSDFDSNRFGTRYVPPVDAKAAARREKISKDISPLDMIDDPSAAAVVMMLAVAREKGAVTPAVEDVIRKEVILSVAPEDPEEILLFSKWAPLYAEDADSILRRFSCLWSAALTPGEQEAMVARIERVAQAGGGISPAQAEKIAALRSNLGLSGAAAMVVH